MKDEEVIRFRCRDCKHDDGREWTACSLGEFFRRIGRNPEYFCQYFEPVIRCKDCRHTEAITPEYIVCEIDMRKISDEGYCSWAERRER